MNALKLFVRTAVCSAVVITQIAAAPAHIPSAPKAPYDVSLYLHPQRLVDIGGRRLNIICTGSGSPTVILEAGLISDAASWRFVQPAISRRTRVCSYDRAALGFSDPAGAPRDAEAIVRDLHALLRGAEIAPPYVLVGWSSGGLYTRLYQYHFPDEVAGMVEVDPDTEFEADNAKIVAAIMNKPPQWYTQQTRRLHKALEDCAVNVSRGTCAFFPGLAAYRQGQRAGGCPTSSPAACALAEVRGTAMARASLWRDEALELEATEKSAAQVRAAQRPYGNLPLIILTDSEDGDVDNSGPITPPAQRAMWVAKNRAQEQVSRLSSGGAHFVVAGSPHAIQLFQPSVVISAIDEVVDQARYNRAK